MAIGDIVIFIGDDNEQDPPASTPEIDDIIYLSKETSPFYQEPSFEIDAVESLGGYSFKLTTTQLTAGSYPVDMDVMVTTDLVVGFLLTQDAYKGFVFTPPSDVVIYKRLVAATNNRIWYEDI